MLTSNEWWSTRDSNPTDWTSTAPLVATTCPTVCVLLVCLAREGEAATSCLGRGGRPAGRHRRQGSRLLHRSPPLDWQHHLRDGHERSRAHGRACFCECAQVRLAHDPPFRAYLLCPELSPRNGDIEPASRRRAHPPLSEPSARSQERQESVFRMSNHRHSE